MMEMWVNEFWLFGTAVIFTAAGWVWGQRIKTESIIASTVDSLIEDGYLKTRGTGEDMQILKWNEHQG